MQQPQRQFCKNPGWWLRCRRAVARPRGGEGRSERRERAAEARAGPASAAAAAGADLGGRGLPWLAAPARAAAGQGSEGRGLGGRSPPRLWVGREEAAADVRYGGRWCLKAAGSRARLPAAGRLRVRERLPAQPNRCLGRRASGRPRALLSPACPTGGAWDGPAPSGPARRPAPASARPAAASCLHSGADTVGCSSPECLPPLDRELWPELIDYGWNFACPSLTE